MNCHLAVNAFNENGMNAVNVNDLTIRHQIPVTDYLSKQQYFFASLECSFAEKNHVEQISWNTLWGFSGRLLRCIVSRELDFVQRITFGAEEFS